MNHATPKGVGSHREEPLENSFSGGSSECNPVSIKIETVIHSQSFHLSPY